MDFPPDKTLTADLCDSYEDAKVVPGTFTNYGAARACLGPVEVITTDNDNSLVSSTVREPGNGRILVVDNGGSASCAIPIPRPRSAPATAVGVHWPSARATVTVAMETCVTASSGARAVSVWRALQSAAPRSARAG